MRTILNVCFLLVTVFTAQAQQGEVSGRVFNEQQEPLANVSIYLLTAKVGALIKTEITDEHGRYIIKNVPNGAFLVQVSSVGYETLKSKSIQVAGQSVVVDDMILKPESQTIDAVTVEGQVPLVQQRDGKLILNVENSTLAAGNNALEVVQRAPGVSVDKDANLQLMGQQGVNVTIDGRQTYMSGEQLATFLKSMNGDQIQRVEVSTIRSAKEDAEGAVGTINIVLKKNRLEGFNGSFLASAAHGKHARGNTSLNLNYKKNNTTVFGSYGYTHNRQQFDLDMERVIPSDGTDRVFDQDADLIETNRTHNYRVGIEQKTSDRNTMLLQFSGANDDETFDNISLTNIGPRIGVIDSVLDASSKAIKPYNRYTVNFNNELQLDTLGTKLVFDLDWSAFRDNSTINYDYRTSDPRGNLLYDPELERSRMPVDIDIYVAKMDFEKTLKKGGKLETGVKYSNVRSDNDLQFEHFVNEQWQDYAGRPNHFVYTEQIAAAYADFSRGFGQWSMKLGLRTEYTISDGNSITLERRVKRDYLDWFPSANVSYTLNENNIFALSYARKIARPNYRYLNPFEEYVDKFTSMRGNPYVNPQYTNGFTLNYTLYKMFNFTLGTDLTNDAMVESLGQDSVTGQAWITRENLANTVTSYLNINAPVRIGKFWTMNNNLTTIYMHFKGPVAGEYADLGSTFFQGRSTNNFKLNKAFSAELSVNYNSSFLYNVYKIHARWGTDIGINYNFKDERSALKLAGTDIFRTQQNNVSTDFGQFNSMIRQYNDNQTIRLTYTYKFGNLKQQIRKRDAESEEASRAR
ncbi:outer membrane beta-barrel protein [Sphingobacterium phlebotomi]|uniref:Outer membrane beta-barrel protein n=1 Tax=Sphingobacterium phlebotomi TaxID=2605433 RepID=A0A5D4H9P0_9SPHI|nr:outer membrane beta-barrel protein [Sphingobacterium phlebotomi]TYR37576.1 outer membrane beta-barrel protein [Sphingobacterium phlebotomi]